MSNVSHASRCEQRPAPRLMALTEWPAAGIDSPADGCGPSGPPVGRDLGSSHAAPRLGALCAHLDQRIHGHGEQDNRAVDHWSHSCGRLSTTIAFWMRPRRERRWLRRRQSPIRLRSTPPDDDSGYHRQRLAACRRTRRAARIRYPHKTPRHRRASRQGEHEKRRSIWRARRWLPRLACCRRRKPGGRRQCTEEHRPATMTDGDGQDHEEGTPKKVWLADSYNPLGRSEV